MADLYELLGVTPAASGGEIRQAYLRLAREKHPDRFTDPVEKKKAEASFSEVTTAFNTLMNPSSREEYDASRARPQPRTAAEIALDAFERGNAALEAGDLEEAVRLLHTAVHHASAEPAYHLALGRALGRSPQSAREAVQAIETALRMRPQEVAAYCELATVLARQGLRLRAQKALESARRLAPNDPRVRRLAAELGGPETTR